MTASDSHGRRGYQGQYLFNWLGATTPVPDRTFRVMAQLGNRILFYEIASEEWSEEKLMNFAQNYGTDDAIKECQKAVNDFVETHFKAHPVNSIDAHSIGIPDEIMREIVRYANLISHGRVEVEYDQLLGAIGDVETGKPEGPQRVILLLQTIVRGLALAEGRMLVTVGSGCCMVGTGRNRDGRGGRNSDGSGLSVGRIQKGGPSQHRLTTAALRYIRIYREARG